MDIVAYEINNHWEVNAYDTVAIFLMYIFRFTSNEFYKELCVFCVMYLKMMNDNGYKNKEMGAVLFDEPYNETLNYSIKETADIFP